MLRNNGRETLNVFLLLNLFISVKPEIFLFLRFLASTGLESELQCLSQRSLASHGMRHAQCQGADAVELETQDLSEGVQSNTDEYGQKHLRLTVGLILN